MYRHGLEIGKVDLDARSIDSKDRDHRVWSQTADLSYPRAFFELGAQRFRRAVETDPKACHSACMTSE